MAKLENISDEMIAAYIDGNATHLESNIIENLSKNDDFQEVADISLDCKDSEIIESVEPVDMAEILGQYIASVEIFSELKKDLDSEHSDNVM